MTGTQRVGVITPQLEDSPVVPNRRHRALDRLRALDLAARYDRLAVFCLMILACLLRLPNLGRAFWVDEGISVGIASQPLRRIPGLLRLDGSPPLWYVVLHVWIRLFGSSVDATHILPLLLSLAIIPAAYWAARDLFGRAAGLAAALLTATNPFLSWYGTETRMYTLVVLLSIGALTFTVRGVRAGRLIDAVGATLCFAALFYTHDWAIYLAGVTGAVVLVRARQTRDRRLALGAIGVGASVLVLYSPWLPTFIFQAQTTAAPWAVPPGIGDLFADPSNTLAGTLDFVVVPVVVLAVWHTHRDRSRPDRTTATLLGAVGLGTLAIGWLASQIEPSWTIRYLAVALAPLLLALAGALASTFRGRVTLVVLCTGLATASAVGSLLPNTNARYAKSNVAAIAAAAGPHLAPGDLVITTQSETIAVLYYYLPKDLIYANPTGVTDKPYIVDWRNIVSRLQKANPCLTLLPVLRALPIGAHVLEVNPLRSIGASGSAWNLAANKQVLAVDSLLAAQTALVPSASYTEGTKPKPYSPVVGELFTKTTGPITCP